MTLLEVGMVEELVRSNCRKVSCTFAVTSTGWALPPAGGISFTLRRKGTLPRQTRERTKRGPQLLNALMVALVVLVVPHGSWTSVVPRVSPRHSRIRESPAEPSLPLPPLASAPWSGNG